MPIGTLTANRYGQVATLRIPAATVGPSSGGGGDGQRDLRHAAAELRAGDHETYSAVLTLMMPAAPNPCTTRQRTSTSSVVRKRCTRARPR